MDSPIYRNYMIIKEEILLLVWNICKDSYLHTQKHNTIEDYIIGLTMSRVGNSCRHLNRRLGNMLLKGEYNQ